MKINPHTYMIQYSPCLLVNFQAEIYKNLPVSKCSKPTTTYINKRFYLALQWVCLSPENHLNRNNHTALQNFTRILNSYSYHGNQFLLANILNRQQSKKSFQIHLLSTPFLKALVTLLYTNRILSITLYGFT